MTTIPSVRGVPNHADLSTYDAMVVVAPSPMGDHLPGLGAAAAAIRAALRVDEALARGLRPPMLLPVDGVPGGRLVVAVMSDLVDETDDVRAVAEASYAAVARAVESGARRILLAVTAPAGPKFAYFREVAALGALASQWVPVEAREAGKAPRTAELLGVLGLEADSARIVAALELGRTLCRDIAGTEPERMAPLRIAALCEETFGATGVGVSVERDVSAYPLLSAVARASNVVERHRPAVVRLDYQPSGTIHRTVILVGKGVAYDTGGADLKTDGHMAGMSRDKGGAGAVAGLLRAAAELQVPGVRLVGLLGLVRNSIGEESFVTDEIIPARSGVRVRIGNTDAEGRLVLADLLCAAREIAMDVPDPLLVSIATLTGHVYRAYGPYVGAIGNGSARAQGVLDELDVLGERWGEPLEQSRLRREDYAFVAARSRAEDVVSSNRLASVNTPRGHQFPFAFLDVASGLKGSALPCVHLDISGAAVDPPDWQFGRPTATPIATVAAYLASRSRR